MRKFKLFSIMFLILGVLALVILDLFVHNFHEVIPNKVYRSRQLSAAQLQQLMTTRHIHSILNLRGANPKDDWYKKEIKVSKKNHVTHYDIALNSTKLPTAKQFETLVHIIENTPKPLLIHCESGVDRSGLAAAVVLIMQNASLNQVKEQISWHYFVLKHDSAGKQFMRKYTAWLKKNDLPFNKASFITWLTFYKNAQEALLNPTLMI